MSKGKNIGFTALGLVIGIAIGAASANSKTTTASSPTAANGATAPATVYITTSIPGPTQYVTVPAAKAPAATSKAPAPVTTTTAFTVSGDGTYIVGTDITPGTYKSAGPTPDSSFPNCYWARLSDAGDPIGSIIANNNSKGPTVVVIKTTDKAFQTTGCQNWVKVGK